MTESAPERLRRLVDLLPYVATHPGSTVDDLAAAFGVSREQVFADLELVGLCGPGRGPDELIDVDVDADGVVELGVQDGALGRPMRLAPAEAVSLAAALRVLLEVGGPATSEAGRSAVGRALAKLEALGEAEPGVDVAQPLRPGPGEAVERAVSVALERGRRLELEHVDQDDRRTTRQVDPYGVVVADGSRYLSAWCRRVDGARLFRLDRVVRASVVDLPARPPAAPAEPDAVFVADAQDRRVVLRLAPRARWVVDAHPVESSSETGDGGLEVVLRVGSPAFLRRLLLGLGAAVSVVDPPEAVDEARRAAAGALDILSAPPAGRS